MDRPTYGLIGRGRVASHMAHYLQLEQQSCVRWHRQENSTPEEALAGADVILAAINDDAVEAFFECHPFQGERVRVHFSGSRTFKGVAGFHPLMTFGPELYDIETYRSIPFIEEEGGVRFCEVFPSLKNSVRALRPQLKPLYHALCVLGGNFSTLLWSKVFGDFEDRLGLPRELLLPYLKQVALNTADSGRSALTGSLVRGDLETVKIDLEALAGDPFEGVFRAFIEASGPMEIPS